MTPNTTRVVSVMGGAPRRIPGIDPGAVSGGCAIVETGDGIAPQLVDAINLRIIGIKANDATLINYLANACLNDARGNREHRENNLAHWRGRHDA